MTHTDFNDRMPVQADARTMSRRRLAKIAVTALAVAGFGAAGLSGVLARHSDGFDDDFVSGPSGGSGWDDDDFGSGGSSGSGGSGGSGWDDDDWVFGSGGSGGSGWDD